MAAAKRRVEAAQGALTTAQANAGQSADSRHASDRGAKADCAAGGANRQCRGQHAAGSRGTCRSGGQPRRSDRAGAFQRHDDDARGRARRSGAGGHSHRHAAGSEQGISARIRSRRARSARSPLGQPARIYLDSESQASRGRLRFAHRSAGHVHAGEHLLSRRSREAGRRSEVAAESRLSASPSRACRPTEKFWCTATSGRRAGSGNERHGCRPRDAG